MVYDERSNAMIGVIDLLNNLGFSLIFIDGTYYTYTEFLPCDKDNHYITLRGKNVTKFILTSTDMTGISKQREIEIHQHLAAMPDRLREFSPDTKWVKYNAIGR